MRRKFKIFSILLSFSIILQATYPSFAANNDSNNTSSDLVDFKETDKSNVKEKEDIDLSAKGIENKEFNDKSIEKNSLKQDHYNL